jgi:hypothetical protein
MAINAPPPISNSNMASNLILKHHKIPPRGSKLRLSRNFGRRFGAKSVLDDIQHKSYLSSQNSRNSKSSEIKNSSLSPYDIKLLKAQVKNTDSLRGRKSTLSTTITPSQDLASPKYSLYGGKNHQNSNISYLKPQKHHQSYLGGNDSRRQNSSPLMFHLGTHANK